MTALAARDTPPELVGGVELLGEYQGSGLVEPSFLLRRPDGRVLAVSRMLYLLVGAIDGRRGMDGLSTRLSAEVGRAISVGDVTYLIEHKLRPLGVIAPIERSGALAPPPAPHVLLGLSARRAIVPERVVGSTARALAPLFLPGVVAAVLGAFVAMDAWLWFGHPVTTGLADILSHPHLALLVLAFAVVSGGFHELGHAAAGEYGGARPGAIGVGVYLVWPAFFSDLSDSYRLSRAGRLRADLGGVYFNVVFILLLAGLYGLTGQQVLLLSIGVQHVMVLQQFLPFLRLDGYYLVSDLTGVPDLFGRVKPVLSGLFTGRWGAATGDLKPTVRVLVTTWVMATVCLMTGCLVVVAVRLPHVVTSVALFVNAQATLVAALMRRGDPLGVVGLLRLVALAVPVTGLTLALVRGSRRLLARVVDRTAPEPEGGTWPAGEYLAWMQAAGPR